MNIPITNGWLEISSGKVQAASCFVNGGIWILPLIKLKKTLSKLDPLGQNFLDPHMNCIDRDGDKYTPFFYINVTVFSHGQLKMP